MYKMPGEHVWDKIMISLENNPTEISTITQNDREPLWFKAFVKNSHIIIENAEIHRPSTNLTNRRRITKKDFLLIYPYYRRWINGEIGIRNEVRDLSVNTSYIFALIVKYE